MIASLVKKHFVTFLKDFAKDGYDLEMGSDGIELSNVTLRTDGILPTSLPVYVVSGYIKNVKIKIPYTSLGSKAIHAVVNDVVLILKAKNPENWTEDDEADAFEKEKSRSAAFEWGEDPLQVKFEEFMQMYFEDANEGRLGYKSQISKMFKRAVNNMHLEVNNVHVRYEEFIPSYSESGSTACHSIGLSVERLETFATDDDWAPEPTFQSQLTGDINRQVSLENVYMYCDANTKCVVASNEIMANRELNIDASVTLSRLVQMEEELHNANAKTFQWWDSSAGVATHHYLISPLSHVSFEITVSLLDNLSESTSSSVVVNTRRLMHGSIAIHMICDPVAFSLDSDQVSVLSSVMTLFNDYTSWQNNVRTSTHLKKLDCVSSADLCDFKALVRKKMFLPVSMTSDDHVRLQELQALCSLHRLSALKHQDSESLDAPPRSPRKQATFGPTTSPRSAAARSVASDQLYHSSSSPRTTSKSTIVNVAFKENGPLGLDIEKNPSKFGHSGVRVNGCVPGSQAESSGKILPGYIISNIDGTNVIETSTFADESIVVASSSYDEVVTLLKNAPRPFTISFLTVPAEEMLCITSSRDKELENQRVSFSAKIESFSCSYVAANIRREILRFIGSRSSVELSAVVSSTLGIMTQLSGGLELNSIQVSDRWNPSVSFDAQCLFNARESNNGVPGLSVNFDIPLQKAKAFSRTDSLPTVSVALGDVDVCLFSQHLYNLLWLLDKQWTLVTTSKLLLRKKSLFENTTSKNNDIVFNLRQYAPVDVHLDIELVPSSLSTVLYNMISLENTNALSTTKIQINCDFCLVRLMQSRSLGQGKILAAVMSRGQELEVELNGDQEDTNIKRVEHNVKAFSVWASAAASASSSEECMNDKSPLQFIAGNKSSSKSYALDYETEKNYIQTVEQTLASVQFLYENSGSTNGLSGKCDVNFRNAEIRAPIALAAVKSIINSLAPSSVHASLLMSNASKTCTDDKSIINNSTEVMKLTSLNASGENVFIVVKEPSDSNIKPSSPEQDDEPAVTGYVFNGGLQYQYTEGTENATVELGPVFTGLSHEPRPSVMEENNLSVVGKALISYRNNFSRRSSKSNKSNIDFDIIQQQQQEPSSDSLPEEGMYDEGIIHWKVLSSQLLAALLEQVKSDLEIRWPETAAPFPSSKTIQEMIFQKFMTTRAASVVIPYVSSSSSTSRPSGSSLSKSRTSSSTGIPEASSSSLLLKNARQMKQSVVSYDTSTASAPLLLPSIVTNSESLDIASSRNCVVEAFLVDNTECTNNICWKERDLEALSRNARTSLMRLSLMSCSLHNTMNALQFDALQSLTFRQVDIAHDVLESIVNTSCPKLTTLTLHSVLSVSSVSITSKSLRDLTLHECTNIREHTVVQALADCENLTRLDLSGCTQLRYVPFESDSLTHLNVTECSLLDDQSISSACEKCPRLSVLNLTWCYNLSSPRLYAATSVTNLSVYRCTGLSNQVLNQTFTNLTTLSSLDMSGCRQLPRRKTLVHPEEPTDILTRMIQSCRAKRAARKNSSANTGFSMLNMSSTSVTSLRLEDCTSLEDDAVSILCARCTRLDSLVLDYCHLLRNPVIISSTLTSVSVKYCTSLTTHAVEAMLTSCPKLRNINLQGCAGVNVKALKFKANQRVHTIACGTSSQEISIQIIDD